MVRTLTSPAYGFLTGFERAWLQPWGQNLLYKRTSDFSAEVRLLTASRLACEDLGRQSLKLLPEREDNKSVFQIKLHPADRLRGTFEIDIARKLKAHLDRKP